MTATGNHNGNAGAMALAMAGQNHKSTPVELRERLAFDEELSTSSIHALLGRQGIHECALISTCNRSEVYVTADSVELGISAITSLYHSEFDASAGEIDAALYRLGGVDAAEHLFLVASGMDSMVIGENQILGQVRDGFELSVASGGTSIILNRLFTHAIQTGKRVRTETEIGAGAVSVPLAAVEIVRNIFDRLEERTALVIGAGETGVLAARQLRSAGFRSILVSNRTPDRATALAAEVGGAARPFEELESAIAEADVVLSGTSSPQPLITGDLIDRALARKKRSPIFLVDLAVPRDIDPAARSRDGVFLYDLDDLQAVVERNQMRRADEAKRGRLIVDEEVARFHKWFHSLDAKETIRSFRARIEAIGEDELSRFTRGLSEKERDEYRQYTRSLINKILHSPTVRLREIAEGRSGVEGASLLNTLFGLDEEDSP